MIQGQMQPSSMLQMLSRSYCIDPCCDTMNCPNHTWVYCRRDIYKNYPVCLSWHFVTLFIVLRGCCFGLPSVLGRSFLSFFLADVRPCTWKDCEQSGIFHALISNVNKNWFWESCDCGTHLVSLLCLIQQAANQVYNCCCMDSTV